MVVKKLAAITLGLIEEKMATLLLRNWIEFFRIIIFLNALFYFCLQVSQFILLLSFP